MRILPAGPDMPPSPVRRRPAPNTGFSHLVDGDDPAAAHTQAAESPAPASVVLPLAAESQPDPEIRDRQARHHGNALLRALAGLQASILGHANADARQHLARLASTCPQAADPDLDATLQAIQLRAAVELAKPV